MHDFLSGLFIGVLAHMLFYEVVIASRARKRYESLHNDYLRYKHGYETVTHDDCTCLVNNRLEIADTCRHHWAWKLAQDP